MSQTRPAATVVGVVATLLLFWMINPWVEVPEGLSSIVTVGFWILAIALVVLLYLDARSDSDSDRVEIEGPAFARFLLANSRAGLVWLPIRLFLGFAWLEAGLHKATSPGWLDGGDALAGFWNAAVAIPDQGRPAITYDWYREFLNWLIANDAQTWFAPLIVFGEICVGLGLIFGVLTGFAAFFGAFMNMSFLLAGSASTNPVMFTLAVGVILAWRVAGYYGVDRYLLPKLGTPWAKERAADHSLQPAAERT
jgi:thiosulfate dehydrogenase [quinone] large subunit